MTPAALAAIEARVAAATPGPWSYYHDTCSQCEKEGVAEYDIPEVPGGYHARLAHEGDAALIANAPTDLAALLAHIRTMEAEREAEIAAAVARERESVAETAGDRAWAWLMDYCKRKHMAPGDHSDLFAIVPTLRALKTAAIREPKQ